MINCPCCSGKAYSKCCEPIIKNKSAISALALMRSRYTAYTNRDGEYLHTTTHYKQEENFKPMILKNGRKKIHGQNLR